MKISIQNFKSIGDLSNYELKPLTILSGTNSSGKSSFIQLLLLLKQTIEIDSSKYPLFIEGKYYTVKNYLDIIRGKDSSNKLKIEFSLDKKDFEFFGERVARSIFDSYSEYTCLLSLTYDINVNQDSLFISEFNLEYISPDKKNYVTFNQGKTKEVTIKSNNEYFIKGIYDDIAPTITELFFSAIFPTSYGITRYELIESQKKDEPPSTNVIHGLGYPNITSVKSYLQTFFGELQYIGPLRHEPKDAYGDAGNILSVGIRGEYVAQILEKRKDEVISFNCPVFGNEGLTFEKKEVTLLEATNHWMCNVFKFGSSLFAKEVADSFSIILVNNEGVETTIKHVGFGISQVLPIIVQGLLLAEGGTLILEQPEIHLHPRIQSLLLDFLYSLIEQNKNIILETHSDHLITRMRRRVAEDDGSTLRDKIKLTFLEQESDGLAFKTLNLDEYGGLNYFPEEFIERPDIELKALLNAQMKKRIQNNSK